jgi:DNA-binding response OmpR family regulator
MNSSIPKQSVHVLILESNPLAASAAVNLLPREFTHRIVLSVDEAESQLDRQTPDLLLCADDLPEESGLMFLARTRHKWENMKRILMVPDPDGELFFDALREVPCLSFMSKPLEKRGFLRVIHHALWESAPDSGDEEVFPSGPDSIESRSEDLPTVIKSTDILILEADQSAAARLVTLLPWGFRHLTVTSIEAAESQLDRQTPDLLLCADDLPEESGLMFLARTRHKWENVKRILMVPDPDGDFFFQVSHEVPQLLYLRKPVSKPELLHLLRRGLHDSSFDEEGEPLLEEVTPLSSRGVLSLMTGTFALLIAGAFVFGVLALIYELKCRLGDFLPEWPMTNFLQR